MIFDEDWDNLVILDACRYDMFAELSDLPGALTQVESIESATSQFLKANFHGRDLTDTVYLTANPQLERHRDEWDISLHDTIQLWKDDGWNDEYQTVPPKTITDRALQAAEAYPNKRLLIHYMQPHYPFLADTDFDKEHIKKGNGDDENLWNRKFFGDLDVSTSDIWRAYNETLVKTLPEVERLMNALEGKTVVTADHGNFVGERASPIPIREWGHPRGLYCDPVVAVPWLEYTNGERKRIVVEESTKPSDNVDDDIVESRLKDLGYRT